ncbi:hypothetical protein SAMN05421747_10655 [Parapedobacter composti]|uniref:Uncharacterized protein n=1 Tax=Parapedobacter composti TaxID=623281 RepID=A0A1I1H8P7_9SPHI|nr:hypothetical protein [Parapedobacter composti]SFC20075.1 hypothetical protein SAMN05421747_10655 [Parapedobacter composti]
MANEEQPGESEGNDDPDAPPLTWREHWFEHNQLLSRVYYDDDVAVYYDEDMERSITWPQRICGEIWRYVKQVYGDFGDDKRLFVIMHAGKYAGGHPSTYFDASHDYRNVIDNGQMNSWADSSGWNLDILAHEIGHIVEGASKHVHRSPAFPIWRDSKWMEIFQYDVYKQLGWEAEAERWFAQMNSTVDDFPRAGTRWFRDWFFPIYRDHGETKVLNAFFELLAEHFPKRALGGGYYQYTRDLNFGEFVHFWSGAAGVSLRDLARTAFGDLDQHGRNWQEQYEQAIVDFAGVTY